MSEFNPDEFLKKTEPKNSDDFNPDSFLEKTRPKKSQFDSASSGLFDSLSLGYDDELAGALEAAGSTVGVRGLGGKLKDIHTDAPTGLDFDKLTEIYKNKRDEARKEKIEAKEDNPKTYLGSNLVGSIGSSALLPGSAFSSIGRAAASGSALGAANSLGSSDADNLKDLAVDTAMGGAIGAGAGAGGAMLEKGISKVAQKGQEFFKDLAEKKAFKALGPYARDAIKANDKDQINSIGRTLLDEGVIGSKPASYEVLGQRASDAAENAGKKLGNYVDDLAGKERELAQAIGGNVESGVNKKMIADAVKKDLINTSSEVPGALQKNNQIKNILNEFLAGRENIPINEAEALKQSIGKEINWDRLPGADIPTQEQVLRSLYSKLRQGTEDAAQFLEQKINGPSSKVFKDLKTTYGNLSTASDIASKRGSKEFANRFLSPSDYLTGGIGAAGGFASGNDFEDKLKGAAIGASFGLANKGLRQYGNQVTANVANNVSQFLLKSPKMQLLLQNEPKAFLGIVNSFAEKLISNTKNIPIRADSEKPDFAKSLQPIEQRQQSFISGN